MNLHTHRWTMVCLTVCLTVAASAQTTQPAASTQPAVASAAGASGIGHVKGDNVYIRSGFSTNYYPVTKLNRGDEVRVLGEEFGWLKVLPPQGTFSLIDKTYVDKVGDRKGVVNGGAMVYAGSNIDDRRYAKQVKLAKGADVAILGETTDGAFYKIEPPSGALLWIKADLVDRTGSVSPSSPRLEPVAPGDLKLADAGKAAKSPAPRGSKAVGALAAVTERTLNPQNDASDKFQMQINAIEAEIQAETAKPVGERVFDSIVAKLQPIADQSEDEVSQIYAQTRIEQLRGHQEVAAALRDLRGMTAKAFDNADEIAKERAKIRAQSAAPLDDIVLRGEIRVSSVYDGAANRPKRWRVVDPQNNRTEAYIEVPEGSPIDPVQYYGKYIGVRASGYRILKDSVQPLPVYMVKEIVLQDRVTGNLPGTGVDASPVPLIVAPPASASQPAAGSGSAAATTAPAEN